MTRSADGPDVVARMFEQHGPAVRRYLRRLTGEPDVANDLAQDVYVHVVRGVERYEPRERERAWLFRIARNVFLDHRKHAARRPPAAAADGVPIVGVVAAHQAVETELQAALAQLDEADREALLLCELDGLRYDEIARMLGLTVASVRSRIYRARLALRAMLIPPAPLAAGHVRSEPDDH